MSNFAKPTVGMSWSEEVNRAERVALFLVVVCTIFFSASLTQARPLNFAVMDLAPYGYITTEGRHAGLFSVMNEAILKEGGFNGESRVVPTKRLTRQMEAKITDCALFHRTPWSETHLLPVATIGQTLHTLIIAKKEVNISRYDDLKLIPIATLRGSHYGHRFDHDNQLEKLYTEDYLQSVRLLKVGRVGAVIGTDLSLYFVIKKVGIPLKDLADPLVLTSRPIWLHCSRQLSDTLPIDRIRKAVVDLRERGFFQNIIDQYLKEIELHSNIR